MNSSRKRLVIMMEIAMMVAVAAILDYFTILKFWIQGGSISLAMVPLFLIAFRRGWKAGVIAGILFGFVNMMIQPFIVHWFQALLDYPIAFGLVGLAGLFSVSAKQTVLKRSLFIVGGIFLGGMLRLAAHFTAGVVWFGEYAPEGTPVAVYSFVYNWSYMFPTMLLASAILLLLANASKRLIQPEQKAA